MQINIIAAIDSNGVVGYNGGIPWHIPEDLKRFRRLTEGHTVIMGRKTWESLPKKPLANRTNMILTSNYIHGLDSDWPIGQYKSLDMALHMAKVLGGTKVWLIGGSRLWQEGLDKDIVDNVYLTEVRGYHDGDTYFPLKLNPLSWEEQEKVIADNYECVWTIHRRRTSGTNRLSNSNTGPSDRNV